MKHRMLYLLGMPSSLYSSYSGDIFLLKNRINIALNENTLCKRWFYPNYLFPLCSNNITIEQKFITDSMNLSSSTPWRFAKIYYHEKLDLEQANAS